METLTTEIKNEILNFAISHFEGLEDIYGCDLHHEIFNMHYFNQDNTLGTDYIINQIGAFHIIGKVATYEIEQFGEVTTDIGDKDKCLNMFVYIVGEEILQDIMGLYEFFWDDKMTTEQMQEIKKSLKDMLQ